MILNLLCRYLKHAKRGFARRFVVGHGGEQRPDVRVLRQQRPTGATGADRRVRGSSPDGHRRRQRQTRHDGQRHRAATTTHATATAHARHEPQHQLSECLDQRQ